MSRDIPIADRVDAIVAALEHPTQEAVKALAQKAREAANQGPPEDRAEWARIADELERRLGRTAQGSAGSQPGLPA